MEMPSRRLNLYISTISIMGLKRLRVPALAALVVGASVAIVLPLVLSAAQYNVAVADYSFTPRTAVINVGDTVTWTNSGSMMHTVTADNGSFDSGTLAPGQSFSHTFTTPGTYTYYCRFHGGPGDRGCPARSSCKQVQI